MTYIEQKALALVNEVRADRDWQPHLTLSRHDCSRTEALCRAIEQNEAFRQEVSEALLRYYALSHVPHGLQAFIITKPDPLVEVIATALLEGSPFDEDGSHDYIMNEAKAVAAAIEKRGGKITWEEDHD